MWLPVWDSDWTTPPTVKRSSTLLWSFSTESRNSRTTSDAAMAPRSFSMSPSATQRSSLAPQAPTRTWLSSFRQKTRSKSPSALSQLTCRVLPRKNSCTVRRCVNSKDSTQRDSRSHSPVSWSFLATRYLMTNSSGTSCWTPDSCL